jgi:hypothetical protein
MRVPLGPKLSSSTVAAGLASAQIPCPWKDAVQTLKAADVKEEVERPRVG